MNSWSNIEISSRDKEIIKINDFEKRLGVLPENVTKIRELISGFEVCHFKYQIHLNKIKDSITHLDPVADISKIGLNHIKNGEDVIKKDKTGKSLIGQQYVWSLREWLNNSTVNTRSGKYDKKLVHKVQTWLGDKNPDKLRLVKLLLARLTWDWTSYEKLLQNGKYKDIEFQASRQDICHYAFPDNLDKLIQGIGQMKAVDENKFEGCGSLNSTIKTYLEKAFSDLNNKLKYFHENNKTSKNDLFKIWLTACLAKTIKENIKIVAPINGIE